jgi:stringent starvation protein B
MADLSTKPYLIRAIYEWCTDSGYTPYIAVAVGEGVQVPAEYVKNGEIVLNVSPLATNRLKLGNDAIEFQARFGGVGREVHVPIETVIAIYARENGQGMAFDAARPAPGGSNDAPRPAPARGNALTTVPAPLAANRADDGERPPEPPSTPPAGDRPRLTRVK